MLCANKHCFDVSKEWYSNLLLSNKKSSGDDDRMIQARRNFLEWGRYESLIETIATLIKKWSDRDDLTILDVWCGEWWYMRRLQELRKNSNDTWYGLDIAKYAVKCATKKTQWTFVVGSAYDLPFADASMDLVISVFSPYDENELARVLKPWWIAIVVWPWPAHLWRFIELIRDNPHQHVIKSTDEKYVLLPIKEVKQLQISLSLSSPTLQDLFLMTPYYRKAPKEKQDAIMGLEHLELNADFRIEVMGKIG
jgi:23S rRNA (guanine745-N1)-methyltransferase